MFLSHGYCYFHIAVVWLLFCVINRISLWENCNCYLDKEWRGIKITCDWVTENKLRLDPDRTYFHGACSTWPLWWKRVWLSFWTPAFPWSLFRVTSLVKKIFFSSSTPLHDFSLSEYWCYYQASCLFVYLTPGLLQLSFCWPTCCHVPCPSKPSEHWCSRCTTLYVTALTHFLPFCLSPTISV